jgi:PAS domain S-box-containing protein
MSMRTLNHLSIRRKQMLIIMLSSSLALLVACTAFFAYDTFAFRHDLIQNVSVLADAIGNNCAAAIDFNVPKTAEENLTALRVNDHIVSACVYSKDGRVFAAYQRDAARVFVPPAAPKLASEEFSHDELHLFHPINQQGETIGMIFVTSDLKALSLRFRRYLSIVGGVFLASLVVVFLLSGRLQRLVSAPILQLAQLARTVAQDKNYSLRAKKQSNDEIGQLADGFNEMLAQIQQRDTALEAGRESLERRVGERTVELAYERDLLQELLDHSPDPVYFKDAQSRFLKGSKALAKLRGAKGAEELVGRTDFDFYAEVHARPAFEEEQEIIRTGHPVIGKVEKEVLKDGRVFWALTSKMPLRDKEGRIIGTFGISKDITVIKEAEVKLEQMHKELLETSRRAGMAEIATNVLHNIGNVLNSVNISASLVVDNVKQSKAAGLAKAVALMQEHGPDLGTFITSDARGRQLPAYLARLAEHLLADQATIARELDSLLKNIGHIKEIVTMQQSYARVSGVKEIINLRELMEDGLRMNVGALDRHGVEVVREYEDVPLINIDRHKVLQILVNLIRNAKHACQESRRADKRLTVRVTQGAGRIKISVLDNGVGIPPENLTRIFNHGFTTRKDGHGFGLHSGALAAKEMGGSLEVHSGGAGQGATFTLELPGASNENPK